MDVIGILSKKRDGAPLADEEVRFVIDRFVDGDIMDYQMSAFLMAVVLNGMNVRETVTMTRAMVESGAMLEFVSIDGPLIDKHSTGGVGDKISLALLPVAAECGMRVPMISGRGLDFTGGTLDKLESIPGLDTHISSERFTEIVRREGGCFGAQTEEIVPADRMIYALRDATATVQSIPLITASILSKKFAEGVSGVVIDVKCGRGAFMQSLEEARLLAESLESVGRDLGFSVRAVITSMEQPLGASVGNALEVVEAVDILKGEGPRDCEELVHRLVGEMLSMAGLARSVREGEKRSVEALSSGRALERFLRIITAQGGKLAMERPDLGLPRAPVVREVRAERTGFIAVIDPRIMGELVRELGGGRIRAEDSIDPAVGFSLRKKKGDTVRRGDLIFEVHARDDLGAERAVRRMLDGISIIDEPVAPSMLFL